MIRVSEEYNETLGGITGECRRNAMESSQFSASDRGTHWECRSV